MNHEPNSALASRESKKIFSRVDKKNDKLRDLLWKNNKIILNS